MAGMDYLQKMRELLEEAGGFTEEEIQEIIKVARAHAGGMASGRARHEQVVQRQQEADLLQGEKTFRYNVVSDLPDAVRSVLPTDAQEIFLEAFNRAFKGDDNEAQASIAAWTAVKKAEFHKGRNGQWRKGQEDGDVEPDLMNKMMSMVQRMLSMLTKMAGGQAVEDQVTPEWLAVDPDGKRFSELPFNFMAPPETIQVLPKPGTYTHPKYGDIEVTVKDLKEFVANFDAGVYGQEAPIEIDFEHREGDLSKRGAVGYVKELKPIDDFKGGIEAKIEWTKRGEAALEADAYKCFSPEWYDEWKHPSTGEIYHNVLIGGALTTRPFFKEDALAPLQASEGDGGRRLYLRQQFAVKTDDGEEYPADAYLVVPDRDLPSTWKLRIWESPELKVTRVQLGRAAAAFSPGGFRGQRVQLSPQERAAAITKLRQLYKSLDVSDEDIPRQIKASLLVEGCGEDEVRDIFKEFGMPDVDDVHVPSLAKFRTGGKIVEIKLTEEQLQDLKEGKDLVLTEDQLIALEPKEASERIAATEEALRKTTERLEAVERERASEQKMFRTRRFTEIVQGRAQGTPFDGPAFVGGTDKHVVALEILADAKGEDSEPFKDYVQMQQAHAEQIRASALFGEAGHPGNGASASAEDEVRQRATALGGDFGASVTQVLKADPALARRYNEERNIRARVR